MAVPGEMLDLLMEITPLVTFPPLVRLSMPVRLSVPLLDHVEPEPLTVALDASAILEAPEVTNPPLVIFKVPTPRLKVPA